MCAVTSWYDRLNRLLDPYLCEKDVEGVSSMLRPLLEHWFVGTWKFKQAGSCWDTWRNYVCVFPGICAVREISASSLRAQQLTCCEFVRTLGCAEDCLGLVVSGGRELQEICVAKTDKMFWSTLTSIVSEFSHALAGCLDHTLNLPLDARRMQRLQNLIQESSCYWLGLTVIYGGQGRDERFPFVSARMQMLHSSPVIGPLMHDKTVHVAIVQ